MKHQNFKILVAATSLVATSLLGSSDVLAKNENANKNINDKEFKHIASLSINGNSFTWAGPPALSHYTVTFCDGQTTGKIDFNGSGEVATLSFDNQISQVIGKGGQQIETVNANCDSEPNEPQDEPNDEPEDKPQDESNDNCDCGSSNNSNNSDNSANEEVLGTDTLAFTGTGYFRPIAFSVFSFLLFLLFLVKYVFIKRKATVYHEGI